MWISGGGITENKKEFKERKHTMKSEESRASQFSTPQLSSLSVGEERAFLWLSLAVYLFYHCVPEVEVGPTVAR
jgi:hypothetical protein